MQAVCDRVVIEPKKAIRKLPRVQHLYARLAGRLRSEDEEVKLMRFVFQTLKHPVRNIKVYIFNSDSGQYVPPSAVCITVLSTLPNMHLPISGNVRIHLFIFWSSELLFLLTFVKDATLTLISLFLSFY